MNISHWSKEDTLAIFLIPFTFTCWIIGFIIGISIAYVGRGYVNGRSK